MVVAFPLECGSELRFCPSVAVMVPPESPDEDAHGSGLPPDVGYVAKLTAKQWSRSFARIYIA